MSRKSVTKLLLVISLLVSSAASAEVYRLQFNDQIFGGHRTVDLKKAMQHQHHVDAGKLVIEKVDVVAKSQQGGGLVWLGSHYSQSGRQTVPGQAVNFNNPAGWTFNRLTFTTQEFGNDAIVVHTREIEKSENVVSNKQGNVRITVPMHHLKLTGLQTINLKQLLRRNTKINPDKYNLKGLEVSIKSRQGGGQIWFEDDGQLASGLQSVGGIPQVFDNNNPGSYDRKYFKATRRENQASPWLLMLNGDLKLNEIIINLAPR
jgi:hypothetical protein